MWTLTTITSSPTRLTIFTILTLFSIGAYSQDSHLLLRGLAPAAAQLMGHLSRITPNIMQPNRYVLRDISGWLELVSIGILQY